MFRKILFPFILLYSEALRSLGKMYEYLSICRLLHRIAAILLLLCVCDLNAAVPEELEFKSVTDNSGIPMAGITSLTRDDNGFIWAASRMGVLRTTPSDCRQYDLPVSTSDVMQVKLAFGGSQLAVSTQNGQVFRYNPVTDRFERWFTLAQLLGNKDWVTNFVIDDDGTVWVSTSRGLYSYSDNRLKHINFGKGDYSYIVPVKDGNFFVVSGSELFLLDKNLKYAQRLPGKYDNLISSAAFDPTSECIWLGTYQGNLWNYNLKNHKISKSDNVRLPGFIIRTILVSDDNTLYIGMEGGGIIKLNSDGSKIMGILKEDIDLPGSLKGNSVFALMFDDQKRLWTSTTSGGLQYADTELMDVEHLAHRINNPGSLHNNEVNYLMTDNTGNLWVATNDGISRRSALGDNWKHFFGGRQMSVLSLVEDMDNKIYATTYGEGVYVLDAETGKQLDHFSEKDAEIFGPGSFIFASCRDSNGDIWFGGVRGKTVRYSVKDRLFHTYESHPAFCFYELAPGKMLAGGGDGLILIDTETGKEETVIPDNIVQDIYADGNTVWVCTSGNGVMAKNLDNGNVLRVTTNEGLHSNYARSILRSGNTLWIGTAKGISCYNLTDSAMRLLPGKELLTRVAFRENAACNMPDGKFAFGTNNGVVVFHPDTVSRLNTKGNIYFSDIRVSGRSIRENRDQKLTVPIDSLTELKLDYAHNSFTLSVLPLGNAGSSVGYSWMLEGQDEEWSEISPVSYINYVGLRPGKYFLHVRMYDGGILSERTLAVTVTPPFWKTGWFIAIVIVVIIIIAALGVRHYLWRLRRRYTFEKIRFFTRMAHDLRTAIMLIKAPVDELKKEQELSEWGEKCLNLASGQATRLCDMTTQLLDFEKADIGAEQPHMVKTDIVSLFKRRIDIYNTLAAQRDIDIITDFKVDSYFVIGDERMLERIIDNLLSNAVKYSPDGSRIEVTLSDNRNNWILKVKDYGMGISKSEQRKLFREFYRAENAVNSEVVGSGIGLLSVKKYVSLHKGDVVVNSEVGEWTEFTVTAPRGNVDSDIPELEATVKEEQQSEKDGDIEKTKLSPAVEGSEDMLILIVDDNSSLREFLRKSLEGKFRVATASNGKEAWEKIEVIQPDLVLSDVMMPEMDGFELCKLIKSTYSTSHIPVILLTSLSDKPNQIHGLNLGADNYLVKPFDMELLAGRISSIIRNRRNVARKAMKMIESDGQEPAIVENKINDEFLKKAVCCVKENIANENFGKGDFASAMMISQSLLYKKIKSLTDLSVVEFIRSIRLNHAKDLLEKGEYNVTEVSEMCGFSTSAYFSRVFKDYFGNTPSEVLPKQTEG